MTIVRENASIYEKNLNSGREKKRGIMVNDEIITEKWKDFENFMNSGWKMHY